MDREPTMDVMLLPSIQEALKTSFAEFRNQLVPELCLAVRGAVVQAHSEVPLSRRASRETAVDQVEKSQTSGELRGGDFSRQPSNDPDARDARSLLRPHKGYLSQKLLAELGEEEQPSKPGPLWGEENRIHPMQPLRALLRPSASKVSGGPAPPETPVTGPTLPSVEVVKVNSDTSSNSMDAPIAPPTEPAPAMGACDPRISAPSNTLSAEGDLTTTMNSSPRASLTRSRRGSTMTEKAFGLNRAASVTSLDIDRTFWIRVRLLHFVQNVWFETFSMFMLCANAVVIGVQTDFMAVNNLASVPWGLRTFDIVFCSFFAGELLLRIFAHGKRFFIMSGCAWNMMDMVLVVAYVAETALLIVTSVDGQEEQRRSSAGTNPEIMRVIRILRAIKVVRLVGAVRFTQDLQLLINCLFRSLKQFLWSALLLLLAIYVVAIYITQAATAFRLENVEAESSEQVRIMKKWWGSMPQSVLSLFQGVTGGVDWHQIADPLIDDISPWFGLLFIVFMAFCILALLNVITGTFVETMSQQAKELQLRTRIFQARRLFKEIDIDGSGFISPDEILGQTDTPAVQEFFETIDVDPSDAKGLLEVIDIDGNGKINFEEFLEGSLRLNGSAKSSDLIMLAREMKRFQTNQLRELAAIKAALE